MNSTIIFGHAAETVFWAGYTYGILCSLALLLGGYILCKIILARRIPE